MTHCYTINFDFDFDHSSDVLERSLPQGASKTSKRGRRGLFKKRSFLSNALSWHNKARSTTAQIIQNARNKTDMVLTQNEPQV